MSINSELTALREAIDAKLPADERGRKTISQMTESIGNIQNGSGTFDLVKVTKYTPAIPAYTSGDSPYSVEMHGFPDQDFVELDDGQVVPLKYSVADGVYRVTESTKNLPEAHRVYYNVSRPYITLRHITEPYFDDQLIGWAIVDPISIPAQLDWDFGEILFCLPEEDGYRTFEGFNYWMTPRSYQGNITAYVDYGEEHDDIPAVIKGETAVSRTNGEWTFENTTSEFSGFDVTPELGCIYAASGTSLIGSRIDAVPWYTADANTVLMLDFNTGNPVDSSDYHHEIQIEGGESLKEGYSGKAWNFKGGYLMAVPKKVDSEWGSEFVFGDGDFTWEAYIYPTSTQRQCLFAYGEDGVFAISFSYHNDDCRLAAFGNKKDDWYPTEFSKPLQLYKWQHVAIMRRENVLYSFVDFKYNSYCPILSQVGAENNMFSIGRWGNDPHDFNARWQGYIDDIRISNIARYEA